MRYSDAVQKILEELEDLESDKIQKETVIIFHHVIFQL